MEIKEKEQKFNELVEKGYNQLKQYYYFNIEKNVLPNFLENQLYAVNQLLYRPTEKPENTFYDAVNYWNGYLNNWDLNEAGCLTIHACLNTHNKSILNIKNVTIQSKSDFYNFITETYTIGKYLNHSGNYKIIALAFDKYNQFLKLQKNELEKPKPEIINKSLQNTNEFIWAFENYLWNCEFNFNDVEIIRKYSDELFERNIYDIEHRAEQEISEILATTNNSQFLINVTKSRLTELSNKLSKLIKENNLLHCDIQPKFIMFFDTSQHLLKFISFFETGTKMQIFELENEIKEPKVKIIEFNYEINLLNINYGNVPQNIYNYFEDNNEFRYISTKDTKNIPVLNSLIENKNCKIQSFEYLEKDFEQVFVDYAKGFVKAFEMDFELFISTPETKREIVLKEMLQNQHSGFPIDFCENENRFTYTSKSFYELGLKIGKNYKAWTLILQSPTYYENEYPFKNYKAINPLIIEIINPKNTIQNAETIVKKSTGKQKVIPMELKEYFYGIEDLHKDKFLEALKVEFIDEKPKGFVLMIIALKQMKIIQFDTNTEIYQAFETYFNKKFGSNATRNNTMSLFKTKGQLKIATENSFKTTISEYKNRITSIISKENIVQKLF